MRNNNQSIPSPSFVKEGEQNKMQGYKFSPVRSKKELFNTIEYLHVTCNELCKLTFGRYLPPAGNIGIFCHFEDEFKFLTSLREELTDRNGNWNQKYYRLHEPIIVSSKGDIPRAVYTYLYIRKPDPDKPEVGDIDFVLEDKRFAELKNFLHDNSNINDVDIFYRPDLDMFRLSSPDYDVLPYITTTTMKEKGI